MLIAIVLGWGAPLVAIQLLFINVVADGIPDLFMCREPDNDGMKRQPIRRDASIFADGLAVKIGIMVATFTVISLLAFYLGRFVNLSSRITPSQGVGITMAFVVIGWSSVVNILSARSSRESLFTIGFTSNKPLFFALLLSLILLTAVAALPGLMDVFYCVPLSWLHWLIMIVLSLIPLLVAELEKSLIRKKTAVE